MMTIIPSRVYGDLLGAEGSRRWERMSVQGAAAVGPSTSADPGGPLVGCCVGVRCSAVRRLAGERDGLRELRHTVRATRGGILVALSCLGVCAHGAVVAVVHPPSPTAPAAGRDAVPGGVVLGPVERGPASRALNHWVAQGGAAAGPLPPVLRELSVPWTSSTGGTADPPGAARPGPPSSHTI
jgi:hypothetical protein